jgi:hypothetical protein
MLSRDDIIRMAREAGLHSAVLLHIYDGREAALTDSERDELRKLERFFKLAYEAGAAAERTRACRIVTGLCISDNNAREINEAIRTQAADRLARHGIQIPEDEEYGNPSF